MAKRVKGFFKMFLQQNVFFQPPFYPSEAEKKGATPAQYGFVFGIANLSLFIFSPIFGRYGSTIGPKLCFNVGAVSQVSFQNLFALLELEVS